MYGAFARHKAAAPFNPIALFPQGGGAADGWLFNFQDLNTLWQDQIGTVCTAPGQRVAMVHSLAHDPAARGSNLTANGDFSGGTTSWLTTGATLSVVSGALRVTNSAAAAGLGRQTHTTEVGATYEIIVDLKTNANGAQLAVGTSAGSSQMLLLTFAPGATQNTITAQFIARATSTVVQLKTNSTTSGHFTEWDNVSVRKVSGWHLIQPDSTKQPILRQDATYGFYYLENDDGNRCLSSALGGGLTVQAGGYLCGVARRDAVIANSPSVYAACGSATAFLRIGTSTNARYTSALRDAGGSLSDASIANVLPVGDRRVIDTLISSGSYDHAINRRLPTSVSAPAFTGFTGGPMLFGTDQSNGGVANSSGHVGGWMYSTVDPSANRAGIRAWHANLMQAD